jgi:hypothetical protein
MHDRWFINAGHSVLEALCVDCSLRVIDHLKEELSDVIRSKPPSVCSIRSCVSLKCMAIRDGVGGPWIYHPLKCFESGKEFNIILSRTSCISPYAEFQSL